VLICEVPVEKVTRFHTVKNFAHLSFTVCLLYMKTGTTWNSPTAPNPLGVFHMPDAAPAANAAQKSLIKSTVYFVGSVEFVSCNDGKSL
jgi:hypothetical protein